MLTNFAKMPEFASIFCLCLVIFRLLLFPCSADQVAYRRSTADIRQNKVKDPNCFLRTRNVANGIPSYDPTFVDVFCFFFTILVKIISAESNTASLHNVATIRSRGIPEQGSFSDKAKVDKSLPEMH